MSALKKNKSVIVFGILTIIICTVVSVGIYAGSVMWIKNFGIELRPSRNYQVAVVPFYLQNDPGWADMEIGDTGYNLGASGCLVTVIASALTAMGHENNPGELNQTFSEKKVYNNNGEVIWYKIREVHGAVHYQYKRVFGARTIEQDLKQGRLPIVKVMYKKTGIFHWVMIVGANKRDFLIMDPLSQDKKPMPLSKHGKVFAYRVLVPGESL